MQGMMRTVLVVPRHPVSDRPSGHFKACQLLLPHTLLFHTSKKSLDQPMLFWRIGCDEFVLHLIIPTRLPKPPTLKDEAVIPADRWSFTQWTVRLRRR